LGATEQENGQGRINNGEYIFVLIRKILLYLSISILFGFPFLTAHKCEQIFVYDCPLQGKHNCNCPAKLRVSWGTKHVVMQKANMHTAASHEVDHRKFLSHKQRNAVALALQAAPLLTPVEVRRNLKNFSPEKRIDAERLPSVRRAVRQIRADMTAVEFAHCPVPVTGSLGSLTSMCESMFLPALIRRHNDQDDDFHLDFYTTTCISYKTDGGIFPINNHLSD
jgi:hypothetical protein